MNPPPATAPALRPQLIPAPRLPLRERLDPARPAAVLVPPVIIYILFVASVVALHALLTEAPSIWTLLRVGTFALVQLPLVYIARTIVEARRGARTARWLVPLVAAASALALDWILPGELLHPITLGTVFLGSVLAQPAARLWRDLWVRHRPMRATLLASSEWGADEAVRRLEEIPGLSITGVLIPGCDPKTAERLLRRPTSNSPRDEALHVEKRIIVSCPMRDPSVGSTIAQLVALGHQIGSESSLFRAAEGRVDTEKADPLNLLLSRPSHWLYDMVSRASNFLIALVALILLSPVFLLVGLAVVLETGAPVFYRQRRMGLRGKTFDVIKFRSMYQDAEKRSGPVWASQNDPRITKVGRFLRKTRLDELPQFWNVLKGEMNLVGPRPERPHFFEALRRDVPIFELRTCVRPGITGWAQVRAPYAAAVEDSRTKLEYDLYYVLHRSLWMDLAILLDTLGVALGGKGR